VEKAIAAQEKEELEAIIKDLTAALKEHIVRIRKLAAKPIDLERRKRG
jgi:hypothetical protein